MHSAFQPEWAWKRESSRVPLAGCIGLPILTALVFLVSAAHSNTALEKRNQGLMALENNEPDSAVVYFVKAYEKGMSRDSFYYYLARTYAARGITDTALALNYSVKADMMHPLKRSLLRQRHTIYTTMGLTKLASDAKDSLRLLAMRSPRVLIPSVSLVGNAGYHLQDRRLQIATSTNSVEYTTVDTTLPGPAFGAGTKLKWTVPFANKHSLSLELSGSIGRPFNSSVDLVEPDTLDFTGSFASSYTLEPTGLELRARWLRRRTYLQEYVSSTDISLSLARSGGKRIGFVQVGGTVDLSHNPAYNTGQVRLMGYVGQLQRPRMSIFLFNTTSFAEPTVTLASGSVDYIDFAASLDTLPPELGGGVRYKPHVIDTLVFYDRTSNSNTVTVTSFSVKSNLGKATEVTFSVSNRIMYFFESYRWYESGSGIAPQGVARNPENHVLYFMEQKIKTVPEGENAFDYYARAPFSHEHIRLDNTSSFALSVQKSIGQSISLGIRTEMGKTWSTLHGKNPPVDIPNWHFRIGGAFSVSLDSPVAGDIR